MHTATETAIRAIAATDSGIRQQQLERAIRELKGLASTTNTGEPDVLEEIRKSLEKLSEAVAKPPQKYLRIGEAASYLGVSGRFIHQMKADGDLPYHRIGRSVVFSKEDLDNFMENRRIDVRRRAGRQSKA